MVVLAFLSGACVALMPFAVFLSVDSTINAALIAGVFSIVNTWLNITMLRKVGATNRQLVETKQVAREGSDALLQIADIRKEDKTRPVTDATGATDSSVRED